MVRLLEEMSSSGYIYAEDLSWNNRKESGFPGKSTDTARLLLTPFQGTNSIPGRYFPGGSDTVLYQLRQPLLYTVFQTV
jgi:hypothetical protein